MSALSNATAAEALEAKEALAQRIKNGAPAPSPAPARLPLGAIETVPELFQPRTHGEWQSDAHLKALASGLTNAKQTTGKSSAAPVLVFWIGDAWACLDGHHRIAAIMGTLRGGPAATVGVEVFGGSLEEAMLEAPRRNSRNKLVMTDADKSEHAWKLLLAGAGTHKAIATACDRSTKSVQRMAQAVKQLAVTPERRATLLGLRWWQAREWLDREPSEELSSDARRQDRVRRHAEALGKVIKDNSPDIVGDALIRMNPELALALMNHLKMHLAQDDPFTSDEYGLPQFPEGPGGEF
jgi:hypothetical protein